MQPDELKGVAWPGDKDSASYPKQPSVEEANRASAPLRAA